MDTKTPNELKGKAWADAVGKSIKRLWHDDSALRFEMDDGTGIVLEDDGQSCCEARYMQTDDDLSDHVGAVLMDAEVREGPEPTDGDGDCHEQQFLVVTTSAGRFTMVNHNEHNGYYGGFALRCRRTT